MNECAFSILICSLHRRKNYLARLNERLDSQLKNYPQVEIAYAIDEGELSIGDKRNGLLHAAKGKYVAFVDDDDLVSPDYVQKILEATLRLPDVVGIHLVMTTNDIEPEHSYHSTKYKHWWDEADPTNPGRRRYFRNPNHLNPVKRELALKAGFPSGVSHGEDREYSARLLPFLATEVNIPDPIYFYLNRYPKEC